MRPAQSPGGTWRNPDGSWSFKNFDYGNDDDDDAAREAHVDYSLPPISELRRRAAGYRGVTLGEPPAHFNTKD